MSVFFTYEIPKRYYTSLIKNCYECTFCYDMLGCMLTDDKDNRVRIKEDKIPDNCPLKYTGVKIINSIDEVIRELQSVTPERPKGKWIYQLNRINLPICSECDNPNEFGKEYKFCPNCGAYMRGGGEDERIS